MISKANWKTWVILGAAVAVFVTSGGLLMASNMGFKINTSLKNAFVLGAAPQGDNWRCLPWNSPNIDANALCNTFAAQGATKANVTLAIILPDTPPGGSTTTSHLCSLVTNNFLIGAPSPAIRVRVNNAVAPASPTNVVLVGSSNETASFQSIIGSFILGSAPHADNWICPPYHTTWAKASDVCASFGIGTGAGNIARIESTTGTTTTFNCGLAANNFSLVIGESIRVRKTTAGNVAPLLPPHF